METGDPASLSTGSSVWMARKLRKIDYEIDMSLFEDYGK
jgi:hypothetical protein